MLDASGNHGLTSALNKVLALESGELARVPTMYVYSTDWRDYMRFYTWDERAEKDFVLTKAVLLVVLHGSLMYGLPREGDESLLARLFELSGETALTAGQLGRWTGGRPPATTGVAPKRPGSASNGWADTPGASPSRYVSSVPHWS